MRNCWSCWSCCGKDQTTEESSQLPPPQSQSTDAPLTVQESSQQPLPPSSVTETPPTLEEVTTTLTAINDPSNLDLDLLISTIENKWRQCEAGETASTSNQTENHTMWTSFITSGDKVLKFVNEHTGNKEYIFDSGEGTKVVTEILQRIGQVHWVVGALSIVASLVQKIEKVSENQRECFQVLTRMVRLARSVKKLKDVMPEEEEETLKNAIALIVKGSIMCISQMDSEKLFRFLKTSVNSEKLNNLSAKIGYAYDELNLAITTSIAKQQPIRLPVPNPSYPEYAVGIEVPRNEVKQLLQSTPQHESPRAVVIYGFGGIGKTTLANAVLSVLNLNDYHYARVLLDEDRNKNNLKKMQQQILIDAFPNYQSRKIVLRDCAEGRARLQEAFECPKNKPIILFIDNALRPKDLAELLPENLGCLPKGSRLLLTTRHLEVTDILRDRGLERVDYRIETLKPEQAVEILCKDTGKREHIKEDMTKILKICGGVPLVLRIVSANLAKMDYNVEKCSQILDALETGEDIKQEDLSERLVYFVYNTFEHDTRDAFLDICCFFNGWYRRHVEYIVGAQQVNSLEDAALVTLVDENKGGINAGEQKITVHDIVRAKGRSMSRSTRIMDLGSWKEAAQDKAMLQKIKGVWLMDHLSRFKLEERHLSSTAKSLRILALGDKTSTSGQSGMKFEKLRYLRVGWHMRQPPMQLEAAHMLAAYEGPIGKEGASLNSKLPEKLSMIKATWSSGDEESSGEQAIPNSALRELDLSDIQKLPGGLHTFSAFHNFSALKILILDAWTKLEELPGEVCRLSSLEKLSFNNWRGLKRVPESFGSLKSLTHLQMIRCEALEELPSSFGQLRNLQHLELYGCYSLEELPSSFGQLRNLQHLDLWDCIGLKELGGGVEQLTALKYLEVRACFKLSVEERRKARENLESKGGRFLE